MSVLFEPRRVAIDAALGPFPQLPTFLAVAILTLNEEVNLPRCLAHIPSGINTVVLDSGSTDGTIEIAKAQGAKVFTHPWQGFAGQRNYCLEHGEILRDWVLFIDADEIFEAPFWHWAERTLIADPPIDAIFIDSRLILDGVLLRYAPGYPLYHARLVRRQPKVFVVGNAGHNETVRKDLRLAWLDIPYLHYWQSGILLPWMQKHLKLAEQEITAAHTVDGIITKRARWNRGLAPGPVRVIGRFFYHYVIRSGYRDGTAGYKFSCMYAWYEMSKWLLSIGR